MEHILDLHEVFIKELRRKIPKRELTNRVSDILDIEKDAAYRRVSGKVNFTAREIGIISDHLNISLDQLILHDEDRITWLPLVLKSPLKTDSLDWLLDTIERNLDMLEDLFQNETEPACMGCICYSFPIELSFYSPILLKFILFKWGHNFVGTEEFNDYGAWRIPDRIENIYRRMKSIYHFEKIYYIWDSSMIRTLVDEVKSLHTMGILTTPEKNEIRDALKEMMQKSEKTLNGTYIPVFGPEIEVDFYVTTQYVGFTAYYCMRGDSHFATFQTNFNFCTFDNNPQAFGKLKDWIDSFKMLSTKLSGSGRVERRLFFDAQHRTIDRVLA